MFQFRSICTGRFGLFQLCTERFGVWFRNDEADLTTRPRLCCKTLVIVCYGSDSDCMTCIFVPVLLTAYCSSRLPAVVLVLLASECACVSVACVLLVRLGVCLRMRVCMRACVCVLDIF